MKIVEITGIPGSGKTTFFKLFKSHLQKNGFKVLDSKNIIVYTSKFPLPRYFKKYFLERKEHQIKKIALKSIERIWNIQYPYLVNFISRHSEFVSDYIQITTQRPIPEQHKKMTLHWFLNTAAIYGIAEEFIDSEDILLIDEGFFHRIIHLFLSTEEHHICKSDLTRILTKAPTCRLVLNVNAPLGICEKRILKRGLPRRLRGKNTEAITQYLHDCSNLINDGLEFISRNQKAVFTIPFNSNNYDSQMESIEEILITMG